jgi:hypothetical protein
VALTLDIDKFQMLREELNLTAITYANKNGISFAALA